MCAALALAFLGASRHQINQLIIDNGYFYEILFLRMHEQKYFLSLYQIYCVNIKVRLWLIPA